MIYARAILAAILVFTLAACAAPPTLHWKYVGKGESDLPQAMAQCDYETSAATQATDYSFRSIIGQEMDRASRKSDLNVRCMGAKGWVRDRSY
jgi:hypothetical protein